MCSDYSLYDIRYYLIIKPPLKYSRMSASTKNLSKGGLCCQT